MLSDLAVRSNMDNLVELLASSKKNLRNMYRFFYSHEFGDNGAPTYNQMGVYVEGLKSPFVIFSKHNNKYIVKCFDGCCDNIWGVTAWIDEPPEHIKQQAEKEYKNRVDVTILESCNDTPG